MQIVINQQTADSILDNLWNTLQHYDFVIRTETAEESKGEARDIRQLRFEAAKDFATAVHNATLSEGSLGDLSNLKKMEEYIVYEEHKGV